MSEIRVRVPRELREWLEEEAKRMGWTVTGVALLALWERKERIESGVIEEKVRRISGGSAAKKSDALIDTRKKFVPPNDEEAGVWYTKQGYHFSLREFMAHYGAQGWKLGNGRAMKDWKLAMVTWEEHWKEKQPQNGSGASVGRQEYNTSGNKALVEAIKEGKGW